LTRCWDARRHRHSLSRTDQPAVCVMETHLLENNNELYYTVALFQMQWCSIRQREWLASIRVQQYSKVKFCSYRSLLDNFLPSSSHVISGVGLPSAIHFKNTDGPGWRVSSLKACRICGGSTVTRCVTKLDCTQI
jgi:hypothetical protein